ncbi:MAG TPA: cytochrome D1 domain-containing protein [Blastocatellia bacterium]|nr:cytochrome D1 domain-containing protein [Blastocatellia bacterium]
MKRKIFTPASSFAMALAVCLAAICVELTGQAGVAEQSYLLVLNKTENTLAIIDPQNYKVIAKIPTGEGPHEVIASANGKLAFVTNYGTQTVQGSSLSVIDLDAKKELRRVDLGALRRPHGIVFVGGKVYFTCEVNRLIARYDPTVDKVDWIIGTGQDATHMLVATADAKRIYTANIRSNTVTVFDSATPPMKVLQIPVGNQPEGIDLSPDGKELWVGQNAEGKITIIDTATNKVKESVQTGGVPIRVKFTPDGKRILVSSAQSGELIVLDSATRKELKRIAVGETPVGILITPDGKRAFVATMQTGQVTAVNLDDLSVIKKIEPGQGPDGLAWAGK